MNPDSTTCPTCGSQLRGQAVRRFCPACLIKSALTPDSTLIDANAIAASNQADLAVKCEHRPGKPACAPSSIRYCGDYEILDEVARGGMGIVYRARQTSLNRVVALKMILVGQLATPTEVKRFRTEAEAAANLQHPNIVAIHEVGEEDGIHYFSMDYVEGRNLSEWAQGRKIEPGKMAKLVQLLAEATHYAHQRGTLHRDLKPQNVLMDTAGSPRITDFGLARRMETDSEITRTGTVMGSPSYMPPEQAAGRWGEVGPASDVYGLGAILYFLLTGHPPFESPTLMTTLMKVAGSEPEAPSKYNPGIPEELETICLKCLEKKPGQRYASAQALAEELGRFLNHEPILALPASSSQKFWLWLQKHPWVFAASCAAAILVLACLTYGFWLQKEDLLWRATNPAASRDAGFHPLVILYPAALLLLLQGYTSVGTLFRKTFLHYHLVDKAIPRWNFLIASFFGFLALGIGLATAFTATRIITTLQFQSIQGVHQILWIHGCMLFIFAGLALALGSDLVWKVMGLRHGSVFSHSVVAKLEKEQRKQIYREERRKALATIPSLRFGDILKTMAGGACLVLSCVMLCLLLFHDLILGLSDTAAFYVPPTHSVITGIVAFLSPWYAAARSIREGGSLTILSGTGSKAALVSLVFGGFSFLTGVPIMFQDWLILESRAPWLEILHGGHWVISSLPFTMIPVFFAASTLVRAVQDHQHLNKLVQTRVNSLPALSAPLIIPSGSGISQIFEKSAIWISLFAFVGLLPFTVAAWTSAHRLQRFLDEARLRGRTIPRSSYYSSAVPPQMNFAKTELFARVGYAQTLDQESWAPWKLLCTALQPERQGNFANGEKVSFPLQLSTNAAHTNRIANPQELARVLAPLNSDFNELRQASLRPFSKVERFQVHPPDFQLRFNEAAVRNLKAIADLAILKSIGELNLGVTELAEADWLVAFQIARALEDDRTLTTSILRAGILERVVQGIWEGLIRRSWNLGQLERFENLLQPVQLLRDLDVTLRGEELTVINDGFAPLTLVLGQSMLLRSIPDEQLFVNRLVLGFCNDAFDLKRRRVFPAQAGVYQQKARLHGFPNTRFIQSPAMLLPRLEYSLRFAARVQTAIDHARIACAIERFRQEKGSLPAEIDDLPPRHIQSIPKDLISGKSPRYQVMNSNEFRLYSPGWNERDDDGLLPNEPGFASGADWSWFSSSHQF